MPIRILARAIRRFRHDTRGAVSVETVMVMPLLLWTFMALFIYWDAFRANNTHIKASYTVADMFSREMAPVSNSYIPGLHSIYRYVSATDEATALRVTSVIFQASDSTFRVQWSRTTSASRAPALTDTSLQEFVNKIPILAPDDTILIIETWRDFSPAFDVGLPPRTFKHFSAVRPRFLTPMPAPTS